MWRQALCSDVVLHAQNHFVAGFDTLPESEIIPLSGVSKSGASCIIHAGGAGGFTGWHGGTTGVELQPLTASGNNALKVNDVPLSACQLLLGIFRIYRSHIALRVPHIHNSIFIQL